jgi:8-oxo-dGTP pyrophosphatase MutT (NUDIX family)
MPDGASGDLNTHKPRPAAPARPSDAASLIVLRGPDDHLEVLLGQRRKDARFAPGVYVFPGGRVDRTDGAHAKRYPVRPDVVQKIGRHCSPRRANALAWAAIRETWEEAGLLVGEPGDIEQNNQSPIHGAFAEAGLTPGAHKLDYIARAITPTRSPIRFNTRFFLTGGDATFGDLHVSSELEDIGWRSVSETLNELKIMSVTAFALEEAVTFWRESPTPDPNRLVPRFTHLAEPRRILLE